MDKPAPAPRRPSGCLDFLVLALICLGTVALVLIRHVSTLTSTIDPDQARPAALLGIGIQFLALTPLLIPLALFWPSPRRRVYQALLLAHALGLLLSPLLLLDPTSVQLQAFLTLIAGASYLLILPRVSAWLPRFPAGEAQAEAAASTTGDHSPTLWPRVVLVAVLVGSPWFAEGALGSWLDTIAMLAVGLLLGAVAARLSYWGFPADGIPHEEKSQAEVFQEGLGLSALLALIAGAAAFGFGGIQTLLVLFLPGLGWLIALMKASGDLRPAAPPLLKSPLLWLVGVCAAFPLVWIDPDELVLVLGASPGEILPRALLAALISAAIILCLIAIFWLRWRVRSRRAAQLVDSRTESGRSILRPLLTILAVFSLAYAIWIVARSGQSGFHGEKMLVILKDQADLSQISGEESAALRRARVYSTLVDQAGRSQAALRELLDSRGISYTPYYLVNALLVADDPLLRGWLSTRPEVDRILDDPVLRPLPEPLTVQGGAEPPPQGILWNLALVQADRAWQEFGTRGAGIVIGQSDSGMQGDHPELADSYRGRETGDDYNWLDPWYGTPQPVDRGGHGTHTLGIILGNATGIAPEASWIGCVNLARNLGSPSLYLDCMQFMLAPFPQAGDPLKDGDPSLGANVMNNSWGCPEIEGCDALLFEPAVFALRTAGIFFVASAGNDGPACASLNVPPPIYPWAFSVGSINRSRRLSRFSSIGPVNVLDEEIIKPDLVAPGENVLSSLPNGTYGSFSGTSMAGPHVVGAVALMWSANPALVGDIERTEEILIRSADRYEGPLPDCPGAEDNPSTATGFGVLNVYEAVRLALEAR